MEVNTVPSGTRNNLQSIFIAGVLIPVAAWSVTLIDFTYWKWIIHLMKHFNGSHLKFAGKPFHLFPEVKMIYAFGIFEPLTYWLLQRYFRRSWLFHTTVLLVFFIVVTILTAWMESYLLPAGCTACNEGIYTLDYNRVLYDKCFISSVIACFFIF